MSATEARIDGAISEAKGKERVEVVVSPASDDRAVE
jgi:hypothetical protein